MKQIDEMTDAVEFRVWASGETWTFSGLKEELQAALGDDDEVDDIDEELAQEIMDEMGARQLKLKDGYPFRVDGYKVELGDANAQSSTYVFCLGLTLLPPDQITTEQRTRQFETVAMQAANSFFRGQALRIGAPWQTEQVPTYDVLLDRVADLLPNLGPPLRDAAPGGGDCGWDVLIVKGFADGDIPRLVVLGNCATGRTDWLKKGMETAPRYFFQSSFTGDLRDVLLTFFAVPFVMDDDARKRKLYDQTITFDRLRICEHAPRTSENVSEWVDSIRDAALEVPLN
jgi:hypothetical protein